MLRPFSGKAGQAMVEYVVVTGMTIGVLLVLAVFLFAFKEAGADLIDCSSGQVDKAEKPIFGRMFQTPFADRVRQEAGIPVFLAGGLHAGIVREAIEEVGPFGLDVCSGVRSGGSLDPSRLLAFFKAAGL